MPTVFHWVPNDMSGSVLYPLNELSERAPEVWKRERTKYEGREEVLDKRVPLLGCRWNDVLHLSPVHPKKIVAALEAVGFQPPRRRSFVIEAAKLDPECCVIFLNRRERVDDPTDASQWLRFDPGPLAAHRADTPLLPRVRRGRKTAVVVRLSAARALPRLARHDDPSRDRGLRQPDRRESFTPSATHPRGNGYYVRAVQLSREGV